MKIVNFMLSYISTKAKKRIDKTPHAPMLMPRFSRGGPTITTSNKSNPHFSI